MNKAAQRLDDLIAEHKQQDQGIAPAEDLWQGIERQLPERSDSSRWWLPSGLGALAASVLVVAVLVGYQSTSPSGPSAVSDWYQLAAQMNDTQAQQVNALKTGYQLAGYDSPDSDIMVQLANLREARQQLTESLQQSGGNSQIIDMLRWINEQELMLLKQAYQQRPTLQQI